MKSVILSFILGMSFWLALNGNLNQDVVLVGVIVSAIFSFLIAKQNTFASLKLTPRSLVALVLWLAVFSVELVKSNIDVALRVISPRIRINPAIVEVQTKLKSKLGRLALANSITLTPGTLTVDVIGDKLYIHWIDASSTNIEETTKTIVKKFEKHLEVIFG